MYEGGNTGFDFQHLFLKFYRLRGVGEIWRTHYFGLLLTNIINLRDILYRLYEIPAYNDKHKIFFSFATKLIHTKNNNKPIYDKYVGKVIGEEVRYNNTPEQRIELCEEIYSSLETLYSILLINNQIREVMSEFRDRYNVGEGSIGDIKALDFIMWSWGKIRQ